MRRKTVHFYYFFYFKTQHCSSVLCNTNKYLSCSVGVQLLGEFNWLKLLLLGRNTLFWFEGSCAEKPKFLCWNKFSHFSPNYLSERERGRKRENWAWVSETTSVIYYFSLYSKSGLFEKKLKWWHLILKDKLSLISYSVLVSEQFTIPVLLYVSYFFLQHVQRHSTYRLIFVWCEGEGSTVKMNLSSWWLDNRSSSHTHHKPIHIKPQRIYVCYLIVKSRRISQ